jgi:hypothetical protein
LRKEDRSVKRGTHKVSFTAEKPRPTKVEFETKDGEVSFNAKKERPTRVKFWAKNK